MTHFDPIDVALRVAAAFEQLGVDYFLGGSLASSFQGEPRSTNDIDFVVDLRPGDAARLQAALGEEFEVDEEALEDAIRARGSWNVFFLPAVVKIDLFVRRGAAFDRAEFERRRRIRAAQDGRTLFIKSPEDTVLRKLLWFQGGGGVSSQQWRDVVQVLRTSAPELDQDYLARWAQELGLEALLAKAAHEANAAG